MKNNLTAPVTANCNDFSELLSEHQQAQLRRLLELGVPKVSQPYLALAKQLTHEQAQVSESQVIAQIKQWQQQGLIRRFGVVVKHRQLGYTANAMVVWNIPSEQIITVAKKLSACPEVSLCYQRPRRLPDWPYNLFCMIHGTSRSKVLSQIAAITVNLELEHIEKDILFSTKAYKQHGARYGKHKVKPITPVKQALTSESQKIGGVYG